MPVGSGTAVAAPGLQRERPMRSNRSLAFIVLLKLIGPDSPEGIAVSHRVAVMHYLLDMV